MKIPRTFLLVLTWAIVAVAIHSDVFQVVDLGYARHAPTKINTTTANNISYATYSNIRFAQPPIGELRWKAPQVPPPPSEGVQDGVVPFNSTNCYQSIPKYFTTPPGINGTSWGSEDCLFLDVIVPEGVTPGTNVPVLHWIYGGGYFFGAKDTGGNPAALYETMSMDEKFIIVASNYRLGAFGFMWTDKEASMSPNAGIYDSLAALEWTRDNIHRFGGDRHSVTVMGQSAGGGIISHLLAASAKGRVMPFGQAILSSPGFRPHVNRSEEVNELYDIFMDHTGCEDLRCMRAVNTSILQRANDYVLIDAMPDGFPGPLIGYAPGPDDSLVPHEPDVVLRDREQPRYPGSVRRVIAGGMKNDGAASTIGDFKSWRDQLSVFARTPSEETVQTIQNLYGTFNGSTTSFTNPDFVQVTPFDKFAGDINYECHAYFAATYYQFDQNNNPFRTKSYRYDMSIQPALHGQDLSYYFFDDVLAKADPTINTTIARTFQGLLRQFVLGKEMEGWPEYSSQGRDGPAWMNITSAGFDPVIGQEEAELAKRCEVVYGEILNRQADGW